ncbi:hypothetical protein P186_0881 [Pyrobaculum ferrireducens]|uniref:Uncharacterized protein n=1 Tax=Pyrobaculum ferrireducens TaxID=1104324 RepID=G7VB12_9CREN|nr:hypothetical protein P186_0881 [Pyrobaculum ferrireducens]
MRGGGGNIKHISSRVQKYVAAPRLELEDFLVLALAGMGAHPPLIAYLTEMPRERVELILEWLVEKGYLKREGNRYRWTKAAKPVLKQWRSNPEAAAALRRAFDKFARDVAAPVARAAWEAAFWWTMWLAAMKWLHYHPPED